MYDAFSYICGIQPRPPQIYTFLDPATQTLNTENGDAWLLLSRLLLLWLSMFITIGYTLT